MKKDKSSPILQLIIEVCFNISLPTNSSETERELHLSYHIVKSHGAEIKMDNKEGEGTSFYYYLTNSIIISK